MARIAARPACVFSPASAAARPTTVDSLGAVSALFHHTTKTDRYVWISLHLEQFVIVLRIDDLLPAS